MYESYQYVCASHIQFMNIHIQGTSETSKVALFCALAHITRVTAGTGSKSAKNNAQNTSNMSKSNGV